MKKLLTLIGALLFLTTCEKQISQDKFLIDKLSNDKLSEENNSIFALRPVKFTICHYDTLTGNSNRLTVTPTEWPDHQAHGDLLGNCTEVLTTICDQDWMVKNLDVSTYRDGTPIPEVQDYTEWAALTTGAWCYYENNTANGTVYGKLYNWFAVNDPRGLAPIGWHIPSHDEWGTLINCLGGDAVAGYAMTEKGKKHWVGTSAVATNSSGFTGLPGGIRYALGAFDWLGERAYWWSSLESSTLNTWAWECYLVGGNVYRDIDDKQIGFSVRCVRD